MTHSFAVGLTCLVLTLAPVTVAAQGIQGLVVDHDTGRPVPLAELALRQGSDTVSRALSTEEGFFQFHVESGGVYTVLVRALGYHPARVAIRGFDRDEIRVIEVRLSPQPVEVEGVDVQTSRLSIEDDQLLTNGFVERLQAGRGQFLTPRDIERSTALTTPDLLTELDYVRPQYSVAPWQRGVELWNPWGRGVCQPRVYLDGDWINRPGFSVPSLGLDELIPVIELKAVELYWGLQAPGEYRAPLGPRDRSADCGVVLLWSKSGR